jgi:hypothetical protein
MLVWYAAALLVITLLPLHLYVLHTQTAAMRVRAFSYGRAFTAVTSQWVLSLSGGFQLTKPQEEYLLTTC